MNFKECYNHFNIKSDDEDGRFASIFREQLVGVKLRLCLSGPITSELKMQKFFTSSVLRVRCVSAKGLFGSAEGRLKWRNLSGTAD